MSTPTMLYHENTPEGQVFDIEKVSLSMLIEQGWVDHPAKIGANPWGVRRDVVDGIRDQFKKGELEAVGPDAPLTGIEEAQRLRAELDEAHAALRLRDSQIEQMQRQSREAKEKDEDLHADADRALGKGKARRSPLQAAQKAEAAETETPDADEAAPSETSPTDL